MLTQIYKHISTLQIYKGETTATPEAMHKPGFTSGTIDTLDEEEQMIIE